MGHCTQISRMNSVTVMIFEVVLTAYVMRLVMLAPMMVLMTVMLRL